MIIQKWSAKIRPMQLRSFLQTLTALQELYKKSNRVPWGRAHYRLYSGHEIIMEREFPSVEELNEDETRSQLPEIRELKAKLLESIVPGTVLIELYETPV
jgi:hypothetical protein